MTAAARKLFWPSYEADLRRRAIIARHVIDGAPPPRPPAPVVEVATPSPVVKLGVFAAYMQRVADAHGLPLVMIKGKDCRRVEYTIAKAEIAWAGMYVFGMSSSMTARLMGLANHTSVFTSAIAPTRPSGRPTASPGGRRPTFIAGRYGRRSTRATTSVCGAWA